MSNPFVHDVLGEYKSEERWLKIFPRNVAFKLLIYEGIAFFMGVKIGVNNGFFMILAIGIGIYGLVWALLSVIEKNPQQYQKGGGITYTSIFKRKRQHKKERAIYVLGIKPGTGVSGEEK